MAYTKVEIREKLENFLQNNSLESLYKEDLINYIGTTTDTTEYYTEVISEFLLEKITEDFNPFDNIESITRETGYKIDSHYVENLKVLENNRKEENFAKKLFKNNATLKGLGKILGFQVPLKNVQKDKAGKIDLISFNVNENSAYLIELKVDGNKETLLRTVLEIVTYFQKLNHQKFLESFDEFKNNTVIKKAVLLTEGCKAREELQDLDSRPRLKKLIEKLNIEFFLL